MTSHDLRRSPPQESLSFDARLLISELAVCVHVSDFFPDVLERNRQLVERGLYPVWRQCPLCVAGPSPGPGRSYAPQSKAKAS